MGRVNKTTVQYFTNIDEMIQDNMIMKSWDRGLRWKFLEQTKASLADL